MWRGESTFCWFTSWMVFKNPHLIFCFVLLCGFVGLFLLLLLLLLLLKRDGELGLGTSIPYYTLCSTAALGLEPAFEGENRLSLSWSDITTSADASFSLLPLKE